MNGHVFINIYAAGDTLPYEVLGLQGCTGVGGRDNKGTSCVPSQLSKISLWSL